MIRLAHRAAFRTEHWLRINFWRWLPALFFIGLALACAAHKRDTVQFVVPSPCASVSVRG